MGRYWEEREAEERKHREKLGSNPLQELGLDEHLREYAEKAMGKKIEDYETRWSDKYNAVVKEWKQIKEDGAAMEVDRDAHRKNYEELEARLTAFSWGRFLVPAVILGFFCYAMCHRWEESIPWPCYFNEWVLFATLGAAIGWRIGRGPFRRDQDLDAAEFPDFGGHMAPQRWQETRSFLEK